MPAYRSIVQGAPERSVFIATPAYESVKAGYALSLTKTVAELERRHIPYALNILYNNCHVDDGRNELVRDFLDNTHLSDLIFIDADLMWEPEQFLRLLHHHVDDIIAGAYPYKSDRGDFPVGKILGGREGGKGKTPLLSVSYAPTGFMRIPRKVFEKLQSQTRPIGIRHPWRRFFERRYTDKTYDGGDVTFCRKWIAAGGEVLIDPSLTLDHCGEKRWRGNFMNYLKAPDNEAKHTVDHKDPVPEYIPDEDKLHRPVRSVRQDDAIATFLAVKRPQYEDFNEFRNGYGNLPWTATPIFMLSMYEMAKSLPEDAVILECGTGATTIILASTGRKIVSLEEHAKWAECVNDLLTDHGLDVDIRVCPIMDDWYGGKQLFADLKADMVVIDGPRRRDDHNNLRENLKRLWPIEAEAMAMGVVKPNAPALVDDASKLNSGGEWHQVTDGNRHFMIGRTGKGEAWRSPTTPT